MTTYAKEIELVTVVCGECGIVYALEATFLASLKRTGQGFYCPNGHNRYFSESTEKQLNDAQQALKAARENEAWWHSQAEANARSLSATRGQLTKTKKRLANGVCPCCHRQFVGLSRHMKTKHPDYASEEKEQP